MEASRDFITSVVVGKDVVPRIGLHQLEALRHDLMSSLHKSKESKVSEFFKCFVFENYNFNLSIISLYLHLFLASAMQKATPLRIFDTHPLPI